MACSHGSTSGAIDEEALFYLRSRGVPQREATDLLVLAFLAEAIAEIEDEAHRRRHHRPARRLAGAAGAAEAMAVARDIAARLSRRRARVLRGRLAAGPREDRALAMLMAACLLIFVAQWPRLQRAGASETGAGRSSALLGGALFGWLFSCRWWPTRSAALSASGRARCSAGRGTGYAARLALFWALLVASAAVAALTGWWRVHRAGAGA